jgi:hypothetical protein
MSATTVIAVTAAIAATAALANELLDGLKMREGISKVTRLITPMAAQDIGGTS